MIIAQPTNLLGNQMFSYAAVKSIALDKNLEFKYINKYALFDERRYSDTDERYGQDFDSLFSIPQEEHIYKLPAGITVIREKEKGNRCKVYHAYQKEMLEIQDGTLVEGLLVSPKYFEHRLEEVRKWFQFKSDIEEYADRKINELRSKYPGKKIISIHFRVGKDYRNDGYLLKYGYWHDAAKYIWEQYHGNLVFLVFYSNWMKYLDKFIEEFPNEISHGTLIEDLCLMTKCDGSIISNSTFSIWGTLLNKKSEITVRPSVYPIHSHMFQEDSFLESWKVIKAERSMLSSFLSMLHYAGIKRRGVNFLHALCCKKEGK